MTNREWMSCPVHSVKPLDSVARARELLERNRVNQLPVVTDGRIVGIVTDRDLRDAFPSILETLLPSRRRPKRIGIDPWQIPVQDVMTARVLTLAPDEGVDQSARLMKRERIGSVPIVEDGKLVGIVTRSDVLQAYADLYERLNRRPEPARVVRAQ